MTGASYTTDLLPVNLAESTADWSEMTGRTAGGAATQEDRAYIQGSFAVSQSTGVTTGRTVGLQYDYLSNIGWTAGFVFLVWQYWQAPKAIGAWADGGMRFAVGSSAGNVKLWNAQGNDYGRNPYGGWANTAIDPTYTPADETIGTPVAGQYRIFCSAPYLLLAVSKGNPHCVDAIRYGRGQLKIEYGESGNYGTFPGMASANDADIARWGLFSYQMGSYLWKGLISLGTLSNIVDFRDANRNIVVDDTPRAYTSFNKIEIRQATSRVDWTAISITALGTVSKGALEVIDDADVNIESCTFTDMDTFIFKPNSTINETIFRRTGQIITGGATLTSCTIDKNTASSNVLASSPANAALISGTSFISDGTGHGLEIGGTASNITLTNDTWTGYAASDGNSGNEAIYVNIATGSMNITISGGTIPSIRTLGCEVTVISGAVNATVTVKTLAGANIGDANVIVTATSGGPMPYNVTVTITRSSSTATVTHTAHNMATNDKVQIKGANQREYNGVYTIAKIDNDSYSYTVSGTPETPATGTIKATYAALFGLTNTSGVITMSRVFSSNQPISGRVRKSTITPLYKTSSILGTIDSNTGFSVTVQMIPDE